MSQIPLAAIALIGIDIGRKAGSTSRVMIGTAPLCCVKNGHATRWERARRTGAIEMC